MDEVRFASAIAQMRVLAPQAFPGSVAEATIQEAQSELSVTVPESYIAFLREAGGADFPFDIYGLEPEQPNSDDVSAWNVVGMTQEERTEVEPQMQHHLVALCPDGVGNHWCLDTLRIHDGDCPVVMWLHDAAADQVPPLMNGTFVEFLESSIENAEEMMEF
ncbi:MAG: SMI1/KNR4 family protein [Capsulimonas sp.]|uniref:SMI1/KNR4 family protein n=1 Tax=Capsulimonas sp. TaxID=2494211 RepID=UPI003267A601